MFSKKIETKASIHELIASRWSGRAYDSKKAVSREQIISLIEAARWAPSCYGDQPWRFIVFDKTTNESAWQKALDCLVEGNRDWAKDAPVLFLSCADSVLSKNGNPNRWAQYDTGAATENLCLQAAALGLMVHQMGGYDADKTRELFAIPEQFTPMAIMTVGYQLAEDKIPEEIKEREYSERARNTLDENFFEGTWNKPIS
ncbi:MAG: nitroreductase family protein [Proteobacteria bacterium]|nr:nitroreductase [Pseudomonadota bacterium]NOG60918.1 nitroreductase family protein [Pseudomonadota bacterium]